MDDAMFTSDAKLTPYWWDTVRRPRFDEQPMPAVADVVVIGSGYTGLNAALQTARGGRHTVILDAEEAGFGCSTRNGGQISTSIKPSYAALARRYGEARAFGILREGQQSLAWLGEFVRSEGMDCDFAVVGRFHAAHSAGAIRGADADHCPSTEGARGRGPCRAPPGATLGNRH